jgi:hypothetical protein
MAANGGDVRQITIDGREYDPAGGDGKITIFLSGLTNKVDPTGNSKASIIQNRKLAGFKDLEIVIDDTKKDLEALQSLQTAGKFASVVVTMISGAVYSGSLAISGDLVKDYSTGRATLEMLGAKFEQI